MKRPSQDTGISQMSISWEITAHNTKGIISRIFIRMKDGSSNSTLRA
jgi:hypothetical protein